LKITVQDIMVSTIWGHTLACIIVPVYRSCGSADEVYLQRQRIGMICDYVYSVHIRKPYDNRKVHNVRLSQLRLSSLPRLLVRFLMATLQCFVVPNDRKYWSFVLTASAGYRVRFN